MAKTSDEHRGCPKYVYKFGREKWAAGEQMAPVQPADNILAILCAA
jgi:hypothetical protein